MSKIKYIEHLKKLSKEAILSKKFKYLERIDLLFKSYNYEIGGGLGYKACIDAIHDNFKYINYIQEFLNLSQFPITYDYEEWKEKYKLDISGKIFLGSETIKMIEEDIKKRNISQKEFLWILISDFIKSKEVK